MRLIFNSSLPRSGSELLQVLLHQNPRIYGSPTSPLLEYQFAARANMNLAEVKAQPAKLMADSFNVMCRYMSDGYYDPLTDRPIVCDKNRGWAHYYEWVEQWNPDPKMICMVRDLRSIIASMERIFRKTRHLPVGTDDPAKLQNMTTDQRARFWLSSFPVGLAMQRLADTYQRGLDRKMLMIRYEDLCCKPQETMNQVYEFIGEPQFQHDFDNIVKEVVEDDSHFGVYGSHSVAPKLRPAKPCDWSDVLPKEIAAQIKRDNAWYFETFNY